MAISSMAAIRRRLLTTTSIHVMAIDGIVNVNSLFTLALFLGLSTTGGKPTASAIGGQPCAAADASGSALAERLVSSHVYSFSSFLFSSLVALALKQAMEISQSGGVVEAVRGVSVGLSRVNLVALRVGILLSSLGSVLGCGFLTMALMDLVQIKLGPLDCSRSFHTLAAVVPLVTLVPSALVIHIFLVLYAFTR